MHFWITTNCVVSFASSLFAVIAATKPQMLSGSVANSKGEVYYARLYAARGIPIGLLAGLLPFFASGMGVAAVLVTAAIIQLLDGLIGLQRKSSSQSIGPFLAMAVHLLCASKLLAK